MEVTDGWYAVNACLDQSLSSLVKCGRLRVGDKIITYGAELVGCEEGTSPLEVLFLESTVTNCFSLCHVYLNIVLVKISLRNYFH